MTLSLFSWPSKNKKTRRTLPKNELSDAWLSGFEFAMKIAWDKLTPLIEQTNEAVFDRAMKKALAELDPIIKQRLEQLGKHELKPVVDIKSQIQKFKEKKAASRLAHEQDKYDHYISSLEWTINGN